MIAAYTILPVIGPPVKTSALIGIDSLYSMAQMPESAPVGTMGIDRAKNARLFTAQQSLRHVISRLEKGYRLPRRFESDDQKRSGKENCSLEEGTETQRFGLVRAHDGRHWGLSQY